MRTDGGNALLEGTAQYASMPQSEKKMVAVDISEFVRTRDALSSAYMSLSSSIDRAVKAYIDHTNVVLAGDGSLNISYLTQPFDQLANTAQQALHGAAQIQNGTAAEDGKPEKRKKRAYKQRDPNAPKRPLTAYFRYLQEQRGPLGVQMKAELGGTPMKPGDLSKEATERWNKLSKDEQQPYRDAYQRALKDYEKEVVRYKAEGGKVEEAPTPAAEEPEEIDVDAEHEEHDDENDAVGAGAKDDDETDDDDDDADEASDEDEAAPPPPPPAFKASSLETGKKTPKSAMKKSKLDSNIDPALAAPSSSPERKRKAAAPASSDAAEGETGKRKRGRKAAEAAPVAQMTAEEPAKKKKKKKADA
ncbi:hypothetical protein LTR65_001014 [Meristemomyces frigidus]